MIEIKRLDKHYGDGIEVFYTGTLDDGTVFDSNVGKVLARGTVESLLKRFKGMARAETSSKNAKSKYVIGNTRITYIKLSEAEKYAKEGYVIKPITLDDLFIMQGVDIES